jgi:hypothetical protein
MIIGLSVLLYKASAIGSLQEEGFIGMNEKVLVQTIVPTPVYNFFEKVNILEKPQFVEYDKSKTKGNIQWDDKEGYKGSIDMILGSLYYMMFVAPFFLLYFGIKYFVLNFYERKQTVRTSSSFSNNSRNSTQQRRNIFSMFITETSGFLYESFVSIKKTDKRNLYILILTLIFIILMIIKCKM